MEAAVGSTIENIGVLDLTAMKAEDIAGVARIANIGVILIPAALQSAFMRITQENIGMVVSVPHTTGRVKVLSGNLNISGEVLANRSGSPDDVLVILGEIIITSAGDTVGYRELLIAGMLAAPKSMETLIIDAASQVAGTIAYYNSPEPPKLYAGNQSFSRAFFELFDQPTALAFVGSIHIEDDVDASIVKQKVSEIILLGNLSAPKSAVAAIQQVAVHTTGNIQGRPDAVTP